MTAELSFNADYFNGCALNIFQFKTTLYLLLKISPLASREAVNYRIEILFKNTIKLWRLSVNMHSRNNLCSVSLVVFIFWLSFGY
jgi:hypothetical protein